MGVRVGGPKVGGAYCTLCEVVVTSLDSSIQDKTNEAQIKQALDVLCYGLSAPVHKECIKLIDQYTDELVDMIVKEYPPNVICNELGLCVDHEIASNAIPPVSFETIQVEAPLDKYGEKLIDALVKEEMDPKKVCSELLPSCATNKSAKQPCVWGPEMWCASPFHARMCGATAQCGF